MGVGYILRGLGPCITEKGNRINLTPKEEGERRDLRGRLWWVMQNFFL